MANAVMNHVLSRTRRVGLMLGWLLCLVGYVSANAGQPEVLARSLIRWQFNLNYTVDALLVQQSLPAGVVVEPGSSRVDETPIDDPRIAADGRALWYFTPAGEQFSLFFVVLSGDASGALAPPEVVALVGPHEIPLAGELSFAAWFALDEDAPPAPAAVSTASTLWNLEASVGVAGVGSGEARAVFGVQAYLEGVRGVNSWQVAIDRQMSWRAGVGWDITPAWGDRSNERFPLLGTSAVAGWSLRSADGIAFRFARPGLSAAYLAADTRVPGIDGSFLADAARVELDLAPGFALDVFAGLVAPQQVTEIIVPDGTRRYPLRAIPAPSSERVLRIERDEEGEVVAEVNWVAGRDYTIDRLSGMLVLTRPEWATSLQGGQVRLEVRYTAPDAPRSELAVGAGIRSELDGWEVAVGVARMPLGKAGLGLRFGVTVREQAGGWNASWQHLRPAEGTTETRWFLESGKQPWWGGMSQLVLRGWGGGSTRLALTLATAWPEHGVKLDLAASYAAQRLSTLSVIGRFALDDQTEVRVGAARSNQQTTVSLGAGYAAAAVTLGGDLRYNPRVGALRLEGSLAATLEGVSLALNHNQQLLGAEPSATTLTAAANVAGAQVRTDVRHQYGGQTRATVGVTHTTDALEVRAEVAPPLGSEDEGHVRFGVRLPSFVLESLSLQADVGVEGQLWQRDVGYAASLAASYVGSGVRAQLALDVAWRDTWKGLVAAQLGASYGDQVRQHVDLDVRWTFAPDWRLRAVASAVLHASNWSLLAYQRVEIHSPSWGRLLDRVGNIDLEGEVVGTWRALDALRLRPAFAYRFESTDQDSLVLQAGLGVTLYPWSRLGIGAVVYQSWQPALEINATAVGGEASFSVTSDLNLVAGYTGGIGPSLLPGSGAGWHLRFEVQTGTD